MERISISRNTFLHLQEAPNLLMYIFVYGENSDWHLPLTLLDKLIDESHAVSEHLCAKSPLFWLNDRKFDSSWEKWRLEVCERGLGCKLKCVRPVETISNLKGRSYSSSKAKNLKWGSVLHGLYCLWAWICNPEVWHSVLGITW